MNVDRILRSVRGLDNWTLCRRRAQLVATAAGVSCWGLVDQDMLSCQYALDEHERNQQRIRALEETLERSRAAL